MRNPLRDCNIVIAGDLPTSWTKAQVLGWIQNNGGELRSDVNNKTTHLLCSEAHWSKPSSTVDKARKYKHIKIVNFDWFEDSLRERTRKRPDAYLWSLASNRTTKSSTPQPKIATNKPKRIPKPVINRDEKKVTKRRIAEPKRRPKRDKPLSTAPTLTTTIMDTQHVYVDDSGRQYDVEVPRLYSVEGQPGLARLQLQEFDDREYKTYACTLSYSSPGQKTKVQHLAAAGSSLDAAMAMWEGLYLHKAGRRWDDKDVAEDHT